MWNKSLLEIVMKTILTTLFAASLSLNVFAAWNQIGIDISDSSQEDQFGKYVALNNEGTIVAIGSPYNNSGHVGVYEWDTLAAAWTQLGSNLYGEVSGDYFGEAISLNSDGTILAIGARMNNDDGNNPEHAGHVRIYEWDGITWNQLGDDIDGTGTNDVSGSSVSLNNDGNLVVIGSPWSWRGGDYSYSGHVRVYSWDSSTSEWTQLGSEIASTIYKDRLGTSVSMNSDGSIFAVGATADDTNGYTRIYAWNGADWNQLGTDIIGENSGDFFGCSVSISSNGNIVAIGGLLNDDNGNNAGHVRVHEFNGTDWDQLGTDINGAGAVNFFGGDVALNADGSIVAIGANYGRNSSGTRTGTATIYHWIDTDWYQYDEIISGDSYDNLGDSIALNANGSRVAVGVPRNDANGYKSGLVRIYSSNPYFDLVTSVTGNGMISPSSGPFIPGTNVTVTATPDEGWLFTGWSGSVSDDDYNATNKTIMILNYTSVIANFSNDPDGDGILNTQEAEIGTNPRNAESALVVYNAMSNRVTLADAESIMRDLRVGSQTFTVSNNTAKIRMYVDESSDLTSSWSNTPHVLELDVPADSDTKFFRFRMD